MRRWVLIPLALFAAAAGCGDGDGDRPPTRDGSTLRATWADRDGDGTLERGPGEPLRDRTELGRRERPGRELARFALVTDVHVRDEESPARVAFLDRLGRPFSSAFRPQEALTAQVFAGALRSLAALRPQVVLQAGDLIDNAQSNELDQALAILRGGRVRPDSGARGYDGIQAAGNPDPFYYRPDVDPPLRRGLLERAQRPFRSPGAGRRWLPALGNHDLLTAGEVPATPRIGSLAVGGETVADVDPREALEGVDARSPDPALIDRLLRAGLPGRTVRVPADAGRRPLRPGEAAARLARAACVTPAGGRLDYVADVGADLRIVVLDTETERAGALARAGGAGSARGDGDPADGDATGDLADGEAGRRRAPAAALVPPQSAWLERQLRAAAGRWVVVLSHRPLGDAALDLLTRHPRVVASLAGDTHDHAVGPRAGAGQPGLWRVTTGSLADFPQQARAFRLRATPSGGVALETWVVDHTGGALADTARALAYLDAQGGRPERSGGRALDRNVRLFRAAG